MFIESPNPCLCNHPVRFLTHIGKRNPAYCTSSGKVLLAFSDDEIVESVINKGLQKFNKNTVADPEQLRTYLKKVRKDGFAYSVEEFLEGVNSVAAPIYEYRGKVIAALTVVGPKQRIQTHKIPTLSKKVIQAAKEISEKMGYRGH